ncbi:MAG TPA: BTAD domain-containing putative transcriptional regulator, partial [Streptosporangiaceae bacterium]|nr:BTAD domain-containing putative transcriptional regulator [Streptosporangiaceae bacterium]
AVGRHEDVVADLTAMVAENPLRERRRALLMLALYRSGRQAEALRTFNEGRKVLAEELGIDPGAELTRLHQRVLTMDPALDLSPTAIDHAQAVTIQTPVPAQLPADAPAFSGRHAELVQLHDLLTHVGPVVISGTAGVGKTALAIRFGRQVAKRFLDGQLYLNLRGFDHALAPLDPFDVLRFFLESLGVPPHRMPADTDGRSALFRSVAETKRLLIVLDNALDPAQVRPLLPGSPTSLVVVTSRNEMAGLVAADGAAPVALDVLSQEEARELLYRRLGQDRVSADVEAGDQIISACARLPLALSIAAGRAAVKPKRPLREVAAELTGALDVLAENDDDTATDVRAVFSWSYNQLSEPAARMFRLLGLHPGPDISLSAAGSLVGLPRAEAAAALRELVRMNMVTERAAGRYGFHDLLRAYAAELTHQVESDNQRREAVRRVLDHYLHTALAAARSFSTAQIQLAVDDPCPGVVPAEITGRDQAATWFAAESPVLLALTRYAAAKQFERYAWQLPWTLTSYFNRRGRWRDTATMQRIGLDAAERTQDRVGQASAHSELGWALGFLGEYADAEAHLRQALNMFRELGRLADQAWALNGLSLLLERQGQYAEGLAGLKDALRMLQAIGHWWTQGILENSAGWMHAQLGQYDQALSHCQRGLRLLREAGYSGPLGDTLDSLGYIYRGLGDLDSSRSFYEQALAQYREVGDTFSEATSLDGLAQTLLAAGDETGARDAWLRSVQGLERMQHPQADVIRAKLTALDAQLGTHDSDRPQATVERGSHSGPLS